MWKRFYTKEKPKIVSSEAVVKIRCCLSGLFEKFSKFLGALSSRETHVLIRPSMQQRPPFPNIWKGPQGCLQHSRGRKECPPQGIVSSLASGPSRESPRSSIPVSWGARMDGPTPLSPFSESTRWSRVLIAQKYWTHQEKSFLGKGSQHQQIQFGSNSGGVVKT